MEKEKAEGPEGVEFFSRDVRGGCRSGGRRPPCCFTTPQASKRGPRRRGRRLKTGRPPVAPWETPVGNDVLRCSPTAASSTSCFALHNGGSCVWMKTDGKTCLGVSLAGPGRWAAGVAAARPRHPLPCSAHPAVPSRTQGSDVGTKAGLRGAAPVPAVRTTLTAPPRESVKGRGSPEGWTPTPGQSAGGRGHWP